MADSQATPFIEEITGLLIVARKWFCNEEKMSILVNEMGKRREKIHHSVLLLEETAGFLPFRLLVQ